jgi:hypothetical protein
MKKVFISYSWEHDTKNAEKVYKTLTSFPEQFDVWMDKKKLPGGLKWKPAIRKAIRESDFFIAVLSPGSVGKRGMTNYEMYEAIEVLKEFPPTQVYLIPARVQECKSPFEQLAELNYVDLFPSWKDGMQKLVATLDETLILEKKKRVGIAKRKKSTQPNYHYKIGLVDLDLNLPNLDRVIAQLNKVQDYFLFTLPGMPVLKNQIKIIEGTKNFFVSKVPKSYITKNRHLETDFIACITGYPLAFKDGENILYNYFSGASDHDERFIFLSADHLEMFSDMAGTKFEEGLVYMLVSQLINYFTKTGFHYETRGCAMDFCEQRADIVEGFEKRSLCKACDKKLPEGDLKKAITALLKWKYKSK